jgi:hypothetical protein
MCLERYVSHKYITFAVLASSQTTQCLGYYLQDWGLVTGRDRHFFLFVMVSRPVLGPTQPAVRWQQCAFCRGAKWLRLRHIFASPYVCLTWCSTFRRRDTLPSLLSNNELCVWYCESSIRFQRLATGSRSAVIKLTATHALCTSEAIFPPQKILLTYQLCGCLFGRLVLFNREMRTCYIDCIDIQASPWFLFTTIIFGWWYVVVTWWTLGEHVLSSNGKPEFCCLWHGKIVNTSVKRYWVHQTLFFCSDTVVNFRTLVKRDPWL